MSDDKTSQSADSKTAESKTMEQAIADMQRMRAEMTVALQKAYGPPSWALAPNSEPLIDRAGCPDAPDSDGETAALPTWGTVTTYPREQWHAAADMVEKIGRKYGFDRVQTVVDREGDYEIDGRSPDGGQYVFGFAKNAILQITTGCYVWKHEPTGSVPDTES